MTNQTPFPWSGDESNPHLLVSGQVTVAIFAHGEDCLKIEEIIAEHQEMKSLIRQLFAETRPDISAELAAALIKYSKKSKLVPRP